MVEICNDIKTSISTYFKIENSDKIFMLVDENTYKYCYPLLENLVEKLSIEIIKTKSGENNKSIAAASEIWNYLNENGATRNSILINLGGGLLSDLGGFVASTFKRGMRFINVPTTLLGMVDAAVGGKTGVNFNGNKNEIGVINHADKVFVFSDFLKTIDNDNFLSGYAEMMKHALISSIEDWKKIKELSLKNAFEGKILGELIGRSIDIKELIVEKDPYEKGVRKSLNFGHTIAHSFESKALKDGIYLLHGHAVAYGIIVELYLSHRVCNFPWERLKEVSEYISKYYKSFLITCDDYELLYESMTHDKKNEGKKINFTLLSEIGKIELDRDCSKDLVFEALDFYRDAVGL